MIFWQGFYGDQTVFLYLVHFQCLISAIQMFLFQPHIYTVFECISKIPLFTSSVRCALNNSTVLYITQPITYTVKTGRIGHRASMLN